MRILIVEDDNDKASALEAELYNIISDGSIQIAPTYSQASDQILFDSESFDLFVLDMTIPVAPRGDGEEVQTKNYGGRELLRIVVEFGVMVPCVVVTQYDYFGEGESRVTLSEIDNELTVIGGKFYLGSIYYSVSDEEWKKKLRNLLEKKND